MSIDLTRIKSVDWQYLANRKEALLFRSFTTNSYATRFQEATGIPWKATRELRPGELLLYSAKELAALREHFQSSGIQSYRDFADRCVNYLNRFDKLAQRIAKLDCAKLSHNELNDWLTKFIDQALDCNSFLLPMPVIDGIISKQILEDLPKADEETKQRWLATLAFPTKENFYAREEQELLKIASAMKEGKEVSKKVKKHIAKFGWIGARQYWWHLAWTEEQLQERLQNLLQQTESPKEALERLESVKKDNKIATKALLKELGIKRGAPLHQLILIAKEYAYLRTWRTDILYRSGYLARGLFVEAGKRAGMQPADVVYLVFPELQMMAKTKQVPISDEELSKRKEFYGTVLLDGTYEVLSGKEWQEKIKGVYQPAEVDVKEFKGSIAYKGVVRGHAKLVFTGEQISKVNRGDILVAVMTFPNFIPAMEKAAAFVTDEGGILCHAAIVSREMKKPCIIATKIATKVLKDGMMVEVDAEKGIIKILS